MGVIAADPTSTDDLKASRCSSRSEFETVCLCDFPASRISKRRINISAWQSVCRLVVRFMCILAGLPCISVVLVGGPGLGPIVTRTGMCTSRSHVGLVSHRSAGGGS